MIPLIGLIVAVYAMARLLQVPLELVGRRDEWRGIPLWVRLMLVTMVSVGGLLILFVLTFALLSADVAASRGMGQ